MKGHPAWGGVSAPWLCGSQCPRGAREPSRDGRGTVACRPVFHHLAGHLGQVTFSSQASFPFLPSCPLVHMDPLGPSQLPLPLWGWQSGEPEASQPPSSGPLPRDSPALGGPAGRQLLPAGRCLQLPGWEGSLQGGVHAAHSGSWIPAGQAAFTLAAFLSAPERASRSGNQ